jgi:hypothetical protein
MLSGKETGGMNVYVRDLTRELVRRGIAVDVFTRSQNPHLPHVMHRLGRWGALFTSRPVRKNPTPPIRSLTAGVRRQRQAVCAR